MPLEFYPPAVNALEVLSNEKNINVKVWTTHNNKARKPYENKLFKIVRATFPNTKDPRSLRLLKYIIFNFKCFFGLIFYNPDKVLYYESYTAWPAYWYLRLLGKKKDLFIHYHEYSPPEWYDQSMVLIKHYHLLEKTFLYNKAKWISHTNKERVDLFLKDHPNVNKHLMRVLPNYPPLKWQEYNSVSTVNGRSPVKLVYVGSLSLTSTYLKEFCAWVINQNGLFSFDIYAYNLHADTTAFLNKLDTAYITFYNKGLDYNNIPKTLNKYDIGIIFYKNYSDNVTYCAPNKLFEYMACGLNVWYAKGLEGIWPYNSDQVKPLDFEVLGSTKLFNPTIFEKKNVFRNQFVAEHALKPLLIELEN
jgi:hypothetical protein